MKLTVCSGASPKGMEEYGWRFLRTFYQYWPSTVDLIFYTEEPIKMERGRNFLIWDINGCRDFINKYRHNKKANGREPTEQWKDRDKREGYSYRFDAWKFCRQGFIPFHASSLMEEDGLLCWLDGDVVTTAPASESTIKSCLPDGYDVAYLGREPKHSEIGFQLYRIPEALEMLRIFSDYYYFERVFTLSEWHSAYVFDTARKESGVSGYNMTPGGSGHVWHKTVLGEFMDHLKGNRKAAGASPERKR